MSDGAEEVGEILDLHKRLKKIQSECLLQEPNDSTMSALLRSYNLAMSKSSKRSYYPTENRTTRSSSPDSEPSQGPIPPNTNSGDRKSPSTGPSSPQSPNVANQYRSLVQSPRQQENVNSPLNIEQDDDSLDSESLEYTEFRRMNNSPLQGDQISLCSSSPKSEIAGYWNPSTTEVPEIVLCSWCKRVCSQTEAKNGNDAASGSLSLSNGQRKFCSEICFNQCRRASYKKSKMCDWCQQVRTTVSYVDFTDGDHQLQFCSDKCLNQYKMHIFCRETEAHLQLHPHLNDLKSRESNSLITPELWLRTCDEHSSKASIDDCRVKSQDNITILRKELSQQLPNNPNNEKFPLNKTQISQNSQISSSSSSPLSYDMNEPINLSTQTSESNKRVSRNGMALRKMSGTMGKSRMNTNTSQHNRKPGSQKCGRPKNRIRSDQKTGGTLGKNGKTVETSFGSHLNSSEDSNSNFRTAGKIRVRQLEDQTQHTDIGDVHASSSPPTNVMSNISTLGGLLMGIRPHIMPGVSPLLPAHPLSELPHPPILPQLLLSNHDLLRFPGFRPPLLFPPHAQHVPPQAQPPNIPTPLPESTPIQATLPNFGNSFPPITVILPLPLPIPIPIPIPIPFPFPIKQKTEEDIDSSSTTPTVKREHNSEDKVGECSMLNSPSTSKDCVDVSTNRKTDSTKSMCDNSSPKYLPKQAQRKEHKTSTPCPDRRKERRSILNYTSEVYEISGIFVPSDDSLDKHNADVNTTSKDYQREKLYDPNQTLRPPKESGASTSESKSSSRKRRPDVNCSEHSSKKKHLLT